MHDSEQDHNRPAHADNHKTDPPRTIGKLLNAIPAIVVGLFAALIYGSGIIQFWLGQNEEKKDHHELKAIEYLSWAIATNPRLAQAYVERAEVRKKLLPEKSNKTKADYAAAIDDMNHAVALAPKTYTYLEKRRDLHHDAKQYEDELKDLDLMVNLVPWLDDTTISSRADLLDQLNKTDAARAARESIIKGISERVNKGGTQPAFEYSQRGHEYKALGEIDKATADYEKAVQIEPNSAALLKLAYLYEHSGRDSKAIEAYGKILAPPRPDQKDAPMDEWDMEPALSRRARLYLKHRQFKQALADADTLIQKDDTAERIAFRSTVLKLMGQTANAEKERALAFKKAAESNCNCGKSDKSDQYAERADLSVQLGEYQHALRDYSVALSLCAPDLRSKLLMDTALVYTRLGDYDKAIKFFDEGLQNCKDSADLSTGYTGLAEAHLLQNKPNLTVADCNKVLALDVEQTPGKAKYLRAKAYRELGKMNEAKNDENTDLNLEFSPLPDL